MDVIYEVWYRREYRDRNDTELRIGVYSTEEHAKAAVARLCDKPGFKDWPEGFEIYQITLGRESFSEGFKTKWGGPQMVAKREAFDLPYWVDTETPNPEE